MKQLIFGYVIPISIILAGIYLSFWTDILKDKSQRIKKHYSFSRTQLMWWTLVIVSSFCSFYGLNNRILDINVACLVLLGISLGTTTAGAIIDNTDINNNLTRHQDLPDNPNDKIDFLTDILSDENGISVHRFQALVFNLIFGMIFITEFISNAKFIEFGKLELTLMGVSSAAYVGLKINENKNVPARSINETENSLTYQLNNTGEDDLMDIDENYTLNQINQDN